jgi:flagellar protein FlgJ
MNVNSSAKPDLAWACQQFEAQFINLMLRQARRTLPKDPLDTSTSRTFQEMLDTELANKMAQAGGVGIAKLLMSQLAEKK